MYKCGLLVYNITCAYAHIILKEKIMIMKKLISAIAAVVSCAVILTACGGNSGADVEDGAGASAPEGTKAVSVIDDIETVKTDAESTESTKSEEITESTNSEAAADSASPSGSTPSFASLDEFAASDLSALTYVDTAAEKSNTYNFIMDFEGATALYLDAETTDGSTSAKMAVDANNNISVDAAEGGDRSVIILKDMKMYILDPSSKSCYYMAADESIFQEYDLKNAFEEMASIDKSSISSTQIVQSANVSINGKDYVFEGVEGGGMLYNTNGSIYAVINNENSSDITALVINSFTKDLPAGVFDIPSDYELIDFDAVIGSQQ